jgi:hypothetical protein
VHTVDHRRPGPTVDTVSGFAQLAGQFPAQCQFVTWLNPYWGAIEHEGKGFEQMKAYVAHKARVSAIIQVPPLKDETYGRDFADMLQARLTFDEALALSSLTIMTSPAPQDREDVSSSRSSIMRRCCDGSSRQDRGHWSRRLRPNTALPSAAMIRS